MGGAVIPRNMDQRRLLYLVLILEELLPALSGRCQER